MLVTLDYYHASLASQRIIWDLENHKIEGILRLDPSNCDDRCIKMEALGRFDCLANILKSRKKLILRETRSRSHRKNSDRCSETE